MSSSEHSPADGMKDRTRNAGMLDPNRLDQFAITKGISDRGASKHSLGVGLLTMLEAFSERTTSHGLPHIYHARGPIKKVWWSLVTVGAVAGLIFNLYQVCTNYLGYPVNVNIDIVHEPQLIFPSVTICNMSPVKLSKYQQLFGPTTVGPGQATTATSAHGRRRKRAAGSGSSTSNGCCCNCCFPSSSAGQESACSCGTNGGFQYDASTCVAPTGYTTARLTTTAKFTTSQSTSAAVTSGPHQMTTTVEQPTTTVAQTTAPATTTQPVVTTTGQPHTTQQTTTQQQQEQLANVISQQTLIEQLAKMSTEQKTELGFTYDDLILDCRFAGSNCDSSNFAHFFNEILGNCYVFNSGWNDSTLLVSSRTGPRFGLQLILNVNQNEYISEGDDSAGMRLVVHEPRRMPFPEDEGLAINPGQTTSIGIQRVNITRIAAPYGTCQDPTLDYSSTNVYQDVYPSVQYSSLACMRTCYQQNVIEACQCGDPAYPLSGIAFGSNSTYPPCSYDNAAEQSCMANVTSLYNQNQLNCTCPDSCGDVNYNTEISIGLWPSVVQRQNIVSQLQNMVPFTLTDQSIQENLCKVEVFYEHFDYESIEQSIAYPFTQFLSDSGGVLGLWLGWSVLTVIELFEFGVDVCILAAAELIVGFRQRKRRRQPRVKPAGNNRSLSQTTLTRSRPTSAQSATGQPSHDQLPNAVPTA